MANNRLYIVNKETGDYLCIAKAFSFGWGLGNVDLLDKFLSDVVELDKTDLFLITENDPGFEDAIKNGENLNNNNGWEYHS
jgi:hypothetical protein